MPRFALSVALALSGISLGGCAASASGSVSVGAAPGNMSQGPGSKGKPARVVEGGDAAGGDAAGEEGAAPVCEPALAEAPTLLFDHRMVVRMPAGVDLVEQNPFYAQAAAPDQATSCGQAVSYAAAGFFGFPNAAVTAVRDQLLELRGIDPAALTWDDEGTRGRTYTGAYSAPADEATGASAIHGWFVLREVPGSPYGYFALYEAEPAAWEALKGVFVASGRSLVIRQRSPRPAAEPQADVAAAAEPASAKKASAN